MTHPSDPHAIGFPRLTPDPDWYTAIDSLVLPFHSSEQSEQPRTSITNLNLLFSSSFSHLTLCILTPNRTYITSIYIHNFHLTHPSRPSHSARGTGHHIIRQLSDYNTIHARKTHKETQRMGVIQTEAAACLIARSAPHTQTRHTNPSDPHFLPSFHSASRRGKSVLYCTVSQSPTQMGKNKRAGATSCSISSPNQPRQARLISI